MNIADDFDGARSARREDRGGRSILADLDPGPDAKPGEACDAESAPPRSEVLEAAWRHVQEFRAYAEELVRIEKERAKLSFRETLIRFRREALVFFALCMLVVVGSFYTLTGLSAALSALFQSRPWLGNLLLGIGALLTAVIWMRVREARKSKGELDRKIAEYEQRQDEQRARFGRHIADRCAQPGSAAAADGAGSARAPGDPGAPGHGSVPRRPAI